MPPRSAPSPPPRWRSTWAFSREAILPRHRSVASAYPVPTAGCRTGPGVAAEAAPPAAPWGRTRAP
jgi:hypothetical protein